VEIGIDIQILAQKLLENLLPARMLQGGIVSGGVCL